MAKGKTGLTISRELLDRYDARLKEQEAKASRYVDDAIASYIDANPNASTAQVRQFSYEVMQAALPNFTDLAETLSCEFMQEIADRHGWDIEAPRLWDTTDYDLVNEKLHYLAGYLNDGDVGKFKRSVHDVTEFYVRRSAQEAMIKNCESAKIRYARVPSGFETCSFCFMLSSRGFVYRNERSAGKAGGTNRFHIHCDCIVVPGEAGRTKIDGYDPQGMYERWSACEKTLGGERALAQKWSSLPKAEKTPWIERHGSEPNAKEQWIRNEIMKEVETRDWHWLYTGKKPRIKFESRSVRQNKLKNHMDEVWSCIRLRKHGVDPFLVQDEVSYYDATKKMNQTRAYADLGNGVELKVLKNSTSINTLNGYLKDTSKKKKNATSIVFDNFNNRDLEDEDLIEMLKNTRSFSRGRVYVLTKEEKLVRTR